MQIGEGKRKNKKYNTNWENEEDTNKLTQQHNILRYSA